MFWKLQLNSTFFGTDWVQGIVLLMWLASNEASFLEIRINFCKWKTVRNFSSNENQLLLGYWTLWMISNALQLRPYLLICFSLSPHSGSLLFWSWWKGSTDHCSIHLMTESCGGKYSDIFSDFIVCAVWILVAFQHFMLLLRIQLEFRMAKVFLFSQLPIISWG